MPALQMLEATLQLFRIHILLGLPMHMLHIWLCLLAPLVSAKGAETRTSLRDEVWPALGLLRGTGEASVA